MLELFFSTAYISRVTAHFLSTTAHFYKSTAHFLSATAHFSAPFRVIKVFRWAGFLMVFVMNKLDGLHLSICLIAKTIIIIKPDNSNGLTLTARPSKTLITSFF